MSDVAIKVENISKTFRLPIQKRNTLKEHIFNIFRTGQYTEFQALENLSFEVKKGKWLGIIGRNGSGKSTLLKIIAGIYKPDSGLVKTYGKIIPFLELGVGFNPELTARENIFLNGTILGMTRKRLEQKFDEIVDFAEIRQFLDLPIKNFSSGMKVRLGFATAIQSDADIYLLDEVLAVGDQNFQKKCANIFKKFKANNKTIVFVSHNLNDVKNFCDKIIWLEKGEIKKYGSSKNISQEYFLKN